MLTSAERKQLRLSIDAHTREALLRAGVPVPPRAGRPAGARRGRNVPGSWMPYVRVPAQFRGLADLSY